MDDEEEYEDFAWTWPVFAVIANNKRPTEVLAIAGHSDDIKGIAVFTEEADAEQVRLSHSPNWKLFKIRNRRELLNFVNYRVDSEGIKHVAIDSDGEGRTNAYWMRIEEI